ncbi:MAG: calcium-binding protein [Magnetospirillum gryphiswaldense]|nr:calcium-binding protein [Magnetospirillum gryphiswaldense]
MNALFATFDPFGDQGTGGFNLDDLIAQLGEDIAELIDETIQDVIDNLEEEALSQPLNMFYLADLGSTYTVVTTDGETDYVVGVSGTNDTVTVSGDMGLGDTFRDNDVGGDTDTLILDAGTDNTDWRVAGVENIDLHFTTGYDNTFLIGSDGNVNITLASGSGVDSISSSAFSEAPGLLSTGNQEWTITGTLNADNLNMGSGTDSLYLNTAGSHSVTVNGVENVYFADGNMSLTMNAGLAGTSLTGGTGADVLTLAAGGNSVSVTGIETLVGGSGTDSVTLTGTSSNTVAVSGIEVLTGNASATDTITTGLDALDVSSMTLSSIEQLRVDNDNNGTFNTITVLGSQMGTGKITGVTFGTGTGISKMLQIGGGGSVDLSSVTFTNFSAADKGTIVATSASGTTILGTSNDDAITGASGTDNLAGGQGADTLTGGGGADQLTGGIGNDVFYYSSDSQFDDTITDFTAGGSGDKMVFLSSYFTGFTSNAVLSSTYFVTGSAAGDADDRFIFETGSGNLYYDSDGNGATSQVLVAAITLDSGTFSASDIYISST